jgi:hypothetical protein
MGSHKISFGKALGSGSAGRCYSCQSRMICTDCVLEQIFSCTSEVEIVGPDQRWVYLRRPKLWKAFPGVRLWRLFPFSLVLFALLESVT